MKSFVEVISFIKKNKLVFFAITTVLVIGCIVIKLENDFKQSLDISVDSAVNTANETNPVTDLPAKTNSAITKTTTKSTTSGSSSAEESGNSTESGSSSSDPSNPSSPASPESISAFVGFYADNQSDTDEEDARHQNVVNRLLSSGANPIFHAGDLMEDGTQASFDRFTNIAGTLLASKSFYGALGNNDRNGADASTASPIYLGYFNFPNNEHWYSVNSGNLHLVVLDSAFSSGSASQLSWLDSDLKSAASQSRITGVIFHHPTYASTVSSYLENNGVDFVVMGHVHTYGHTSSGGINYFTLPGGGSLGYATASIYSNYLNFKVYNESGGLIDSQTISAR